MRYRCSCAICMIRWRIHAIPIGQVFRIMHPAAASIIAKVGHGSLGSACWNLQSGELRSFNEAFLSFADLRLPDAVASVPPIWRDLFSGSSCIYLTESTKQHVSASINLLINIEDSFRLGQSTTRTANMNFVTRIGRQKVQVGAAKARAHIFFFVQQLCTVTFYYLPSSQRYNRTCEILWLINRQHTPEEESPVLVSCSATIQAPRRKAFPWTVQRFSLSVKKMPGQHKEY